jgi:tRNA pseudouridine55 synthase
MKASSEFTKYDGALLVDKPAGPTSHDVVDAIRHYFGIAKAGHCGTLDPSATGLLVVVLGRATKLSEKFMAADKVYEGTACFGITTNTHDADGEVVDTKPVPQLTLEQLNAEAEKFEGDIMQLPPMMSAVKKDGVPLYKLARRGVEVERKERLVHIYRFRFLDYEAPLAWFRVASSKGTYVRTLIHDLGQHIGCGAHLKHLRRIASGQFDVADAIQFEELLRMSPDEAAGRIIPFLKLAAMQ